MTYPGASDPVTAFTRPDGTTEGHDDDHGRVIHIWENVKHHGATGDGATDDSTAIQAAINAVQTLGGIVFFPPGVYVLATGLTMTSNVRLVGAVSTISEFANHTIGTILKYTPSTGTAITVTANANHNGPSIEHIGLWGPSAGGSTIGLFLNGASSVMQVGSLKSVRVKGFGTGIKLNNAYQIGIYDCYCDGNGTGLHFTNVANANSVFGGGYRENVTGVRIEDSSSIYMSGVTVESNSATGLLVDGNTWSQAGHIINGHFENNPRGIYFNPGITCQDCRIMGAFITASSIAGLEVQNTSDLIADLTQIDGSVVLGPATLNCHIRNTRRLTVTDTGNQNVTMWGNDFTQGFFKIGTGNQGGGNYSGVNIVGAIKLTEVLDPWGAPDANTAHLMLRDNGAGKTQLVIRFPTGATQVISTEP